MSKLGPNVGTTLWRYRPPVILSVAKDLGSLLCFSDLRRTAEILRCHENDPPPQREEGWGVVGRLIGNAQPPLTPPCQGGESLSCQPASRGIMASSLGMTDESMVRKGRKLIADG